mgnify:CR=1 FL=1
MQANFEVKYLDVSWYDKETVLKVVESFLPLNVDFIPESQSFTCDAFLYPEAPEIKHGQLAFRFLTKSPIEPYFELANGSRVSLKKVVDSDTGKIWWIEANHWVGKNKCWERKSHRTAGQIIIQLNSQRCQINIGSSEFTAPQLERYLADFKSDLWELILDESSYITGEAKQINDGGINEESIVLINNILSHAQKILQKPKSELREIQMLKPRKLVKPVTRTFMELATKGDSRFLTSRATKASYNVPENRYVFFALERIFKILKQVVTISNSKINRFENKIQKLNERYNSFKDERLIDKNLVRKDLEKLRLAYNVDELNKSLIRKSDIEINPSESLPIWYLKVGNKTNNGQSYFIGVKTDFNATWFEARKGVQSVFLELDNDCYKDLIQTNFEYELEAKITYSTGVTKYGVAWYTYKLHKISRIKIIGGKRVQDLQNKFLKEKEKALLLNSKDWIKKLTHKELTEQNREKRSVQKQIHFYQVSYDKSKYVHALIAPKLLKFKDLLAEFKNMGVKPISTFPNSMTFVQNPDYQAVHSGYKKIREFANLSDDDLLLSLEKIEKIGLINMPLLYERWCLLQIIKVLVQSYFYIPSEDWKRKLLRIVETGKHNQSIEFVNIKLKRRIKLWYEPNLDNGRTPDLVMDVFFQRKNGDENKKRLVMDAKFYSDDLLRRIGGISKVINELYHIKDYSEGGENAVFMLHPAKNSINDKVSPQGWGSNSYLGELAMFKWDSHLRPENFHEYGAVCVNPVLRLSYLDEVQRLIGMFFQYGIEDNNLQRRPDDVESINFCIACGAHDLKHVTKTNGNPRSSWYECNNCLHFTTYNHCYSCDTRLIKNGDYWSYHSQMPMEPLNIKCPKCESLV